MWELILIVAYVILNIYNTQAKRRNIVIKEDYTTYLIRNIPRNEWKKIRMLCLDKGVKVNELMLDVVNKISSNKLIGKTILQKVGNNAD